MGKSANTDSELIIVGGGPAGLTAGIYAARSRLNCLLIEKGMFGGMIVTAELVENFPGFPDGISGYDLGELLYQQAVRFGLKTQTAEVTALELHNAQKLVKTGEGTVSAKAVILAGGSERIKLDVPGEAKYTGRGVSYCATCDGAFFQDAKVAVIGGGNSAVIEALQLAKLAQKVTVIHRRDQLRATRANQEKAFAEPKIEFLWNTVVKAVEGGDFVQGLRLRDVVTGKESTLDVAGVFVSVGLKPNTGYLKGVVPLDDYGYIITDKKMETEVPGVFAAGDIRYESGRQSIIAAGDGATAAIFAERYLGQ